MLKRFLETALRFIFLVAEFTLKKRGDIDLYIIPRFKDNLLERRAKFLAKLWSALEEQRIDIILEKDPERKFEKKLYQKGLNFEREI